MSMRRLTCLLFMAELACGTALRAQQSAQATMGPQSPSSRVTQPPVSFDVARFDSLTAIQLRDIFDMAAAAGLPTQKLVNRALQGAGMGKNGKAILAKVREHASALAEARIALGLTSTATELDAGADALRVGIPASTLAQIRASRPGASVEMPLMVITDLVSSRGVPVANARDAVTALARLPKADDALMSLQQVVAKNSVRGPGMALDALNRYVKGTVAGNGLSSTSATPDRKPPRPPTP
jgi:hypothetical protein